VPGRATARAGPRADEIGGLRAAAAYDPRGTSRSLLPLPRSRTTPIIRARGRRHRARWPRRSGRPPIEDLQQKARSRSDADASSPTAARRGGGSTSSTRRALGSRSGPAGWRDRGGRIGGQHRRRGRGTGGRSGPRPGCGPRDVAASGGRCSSSPVRRCDEEVGDVRLGRPRVRSVDAAGGEEGEIAAPSRSIGRERMPRQPLLDVEVGQPLVAPPARDRRRAARSRHRGHATIDEVRAGRRPRRRPGR
jgi:hypothetical protein